MARLIAFESVSDRSNLPLIAFVEDTLAALGVASRRAPNGSRDKAALLATVGPRVDGGVALSGHTDVVPVEGQAWTSPPFVMREADGRLYGRGACDMKGFIACVLAMVPTFQAAKLKRPVHIVLSYDEETTCLGSTDVIGWFGKDEPRPAAVVVGEPTMMEVADAHKSVATIHTVVTRPRGPFRIARPRRQRDRGGGRHRQRDRPPRPGIREGAARSAFRAALFDPPCRGDAWRDGAQYSRPRMRLRLGVPRPAGRCRRPSPVAEVQAFVDTVALPRLTRFVSGPTIVTQIEADVPSLAAEPGSPAETLALRLTRSNRTIAVSFATESGHFQRAGLPTIVCGPGSIDQAHKPDEYVEESQLAACLDFLDNLAGELSR